MEVGTVSRIEQKMKSNPRKLEVQPGEFYLANQREEDEVLVILFQGLWTSLADAFIGGGIVKSRNNLGDSTLVLMNEADEYLFEE